MGNSKACYSVYNFSGFGYLLQEVIKGFLKLVLPLAQLTQKGQAYVWDVQCEESFKELKRKLTFAPVLILPNSSESIIVY